MAIYNYYYKVVALNTVRRLSWNTVTHQATENILTFPIAYPPPPGVDIVYSDGTIVDMYQKTPTTVAILTYNGSVNGLSTPLTYPRLYLTETIISNSVLVFKKCNVLSPPLFQYGIFNLVEESMDQLETPISYSPFCSAFALSESYIIKQTCIGTTLRRWYYDGDDAIIIVDDPNNTSCGYVAPVPDVVITESKRIKIDQSCIDENDLYLIWKNTLGGWDQWLFKKNQTRNLLTDDQGNFQKPEYTLEDSTGALNSLGTDAGNSLILGANGLTTNQYEAIAELLYAPITYWIQLTSSGYTKTKVKAKPGTFSKEKKNGFHNIEFEISLPDTNTVKS